MLRHFYKDSSGAGFIVIANEPAERGREAGEAEAS